MSHYDFRRLAEIIPSGKCDPRGVLPLSNGLIVVGTFDGSIELYDTHQYKLVLKEMTFHKSPKTDAVSR